MRTSRESPLYPEGIAPELILYSSILLCNRVNSGKGEKKGNQHRRRRRRRSGEAARALRSDAAEGLRCRMNSKYSKCSQCIKYSKYSKYGKYDKYRKHGSYRVVGARTRDQDSKHCKYCMVRIVIMESAVLSVVVSVQCMS